MITLAQASDRLRLHLLDQRLGDALQRFMSLDHQTAHGSMLHSRQTMRLIPPKAVSRRCAPGSGIVAVLPSVDSNDPNGTSPVSGSMGACCLGRRLSESSCTANAGPERHRRQHRGTDSAGDWSHRWHWEADCDRFGAKGRQRYARVLSKAFWHTGRSYQHSVLCGEVLPCFHHRVRSMLWCACHINCHAPVAFLNSPRLHVH
jgi:hypothetical protein